jgi:hypothetical protein
MTERDTMAELKESKTEKDLMDSLEEVDYYVCSV